MKTTTERLLMSTSAVEQRFALLRKEVDAYNRAPRTTYLAHSLGENQLTVMTREPPRTPVLRIVK